MAEKREAPVTPQGMPKSLKAAILGAGADLLQDTTPVKQIDISVVGFHCAKYHPQMQMEAHHYCHQVNEEFLQCVLFDGNTEDANLIGIEYIISERLFHTLSDEEKRSGTRTTTRSCPDSSWLPACRSWLKKRCSSCS